MSKRVVVIGSGGREHAICWKLAKSEHLSAIFAIPGSYGIGRMDKCANVGSDVLDPNDFQAIAVWCKINEINLVVVGPEGPLANDICGVLRAAGVACFGPDGHGAQIESDKAWSKEFMVRYGIPTARYQTFTDTQKAKDFIDSRKDYKPYVVKASGLASGKGVVVAANKAEAHQAVDDILGEKKYGSAGHKIVVEELLAGEEVSVFAFVDGKTIKQMLPAQDHKRLRDNDEGPNTGGMGAYCPCPLVDSDIKKLIQRQVLDRTLDGFQREGIHYVGVLYVGLMLTSHGPKVLEYNCRFGDPETQVLLPLLKSDLYEAIEACVLNNLASVRLQWRVGVSAVGVVMARAGYPEPSTQNYLITGLKPRNLPTRFVFHSGITVSLIGELYTNAGRVLTVVALHTRLKEASTRATNLCRKIHFEGAQFRSDIGARGFYLTPVPFPTSPVPPPLVPPPPPPTEATYENSGVDISNATELVKRIKVITQGTRRDIRMGTIGGFAGLMDIGKLTYENPIICEATSGVSSKIMVMNSQKIYTGIGYDLVAMCANDLLETGAEPIAFLDYIACGGLCVTDTSVLIAGMTDGCIAANVALVGGETAEMPKMYKSGCYDVAGYCVGLVEQNRELPRFDRYDEGDLLIGLPSSGLHCAGFNDLLSGLLAQDVFLSSKCEFLTTPLTLGQVLSTPTRVYVRQMLPLLQGGYVKSLAHVTHGLLPDVGRIMPEDFEITLDFADIEVPVVFGWLAARLNLSTEAMLLQHNCGVGLVFVVSKNNKVWRTLDGSKVLGVLKRRTAGDSATSNQAEQIQVKNFEESLEAVAREYGGIGDYTPQETLDLHDMGKKLVAGTVQRNGTYTSQSGKRLTRMPKGFKDPVLVLSTDGVGTKLKIAQAAGIHSVTGIDLVAMCVNDLLCMGATPLTFTTYYACGDLQRSLAEKIVDGVAKGVDKAGCTLTDLHIAETPLLYQPSVYDLAGFSLGIIERENILPTLDKIHVGDFVIGLPSSGLHSNGFSLVRQVMDLIGVTPNNQMPVSSKTYADLLLKPTNIYVKSVLPLFKNYGIKAVAHITGGGLLENIPRVLPEHLAVTINASDFNIPPVFGWLRRDGNIEDKEMQTVFNCGIGLILIIDRIYLNSLISALQYPERAEAVGTVCERIKGGKQVIIKNFDTCITRVVNCLNNKRIRVAVLISGNGSNMQALIEAANDESQGLNAFIAIVVCNNPKANGIRLAQRAGVYTEILQHSNYNSRDDYDMALSTLLKKARVDMVCLAGFMRLLGPRFVNDWRYRVLNIHPSLLPKYPGMNAQQKALQAGEKTTGCTVHFVDEGVDTGVIILKTMVDILPDDTVETLTARIHKAEHYTYPKALRMLTTNKVFIDKNGKLEYSK